MKKAKVSSGPGDPPKIDTEKLYSSIYKLVPQACLFTIVPIPEEQADTQVVIGPTHTLQQPMTPSDNLRKQTTSNQDLEQPTTMCHPSVELSQAKM